MTRVIQPFAVRRDEPTPMISFRRNDRDRAPARIVRMPNDGPAPDRMQRAEELRSALKPAFVSRAAAVTEAAVAERLERDRSAILVMLLDGEYNITTISRQTGINPDRLTTLTKELAHDGLIHRYDKARTGGGRIVVCSLTGVGRERAWSLRQ